MHKISNFTGQARHGWERMTPAAFGMSRMHQDMPSQQPLRRPQGSPNVVPPTASEHSIVNLSFNVPFSSNLAGPEKDEVLHASPGALQRWTFPADTPDGASIHQLPVHVQNEERLRNLCRYISEQSGGRMEASVTSSEPKTAPALHTRTQGLITNVCISGENELVHKMRAKILNDTPIMMVQSILSLPNDHFTNFTSQAFCNGRYRSQPHSRRGRDEHSIQRFEPH